jgi:hypothetical protein
MGDMELILKGIDEIKREIGGINTNVALLQSSVCILKSTSEENEACLDAIKRELHGTNGDKGLFPRVNKIEEWISTRSFYEKAIILAFIGETVALMFAFIKIL